MSAVDRLRQRIAPAPLNRLIDSALAREATTYVFAALLSSGISFLMLPVFAHLLTPAQLAPVALVQSIMTMVPALLSLGLRGLVLRDFSAGDEPRARDGLASALAIGLGSGAVLALLVGLQAWWFPQVQLLPIGWLLLGVVAGTLTMPIQLVQSVLQAKRAARTFAVLQLSTAAVAIPASLALLLLYPGQWWARAAGVVLAPVLIGVVALGYATRRGWIGSLRAGRTADYRRFTIALLPHAALAALAGTADRWLAGYTGDAAALGKYAVAAQMVSLISVLGFALSAALDPWWLRRVAAMRARHDWRKIQRDAVVVTVLLFAAGACFVGLLYLAVPILLPPAYAGALRYIPLLATAAVLHIVYQQFNEPIYYFKYSRVLGWLGAVNLVVTLGAMIGFAAWLGPIGIALALVLSRGLLAGGAAIAAERIVRREIP